MAAGRHLVLNGHMDTIPLGPRDSWTVEPFALTDQKDRLLGLGAGNMKGAVAALLIAYAWLVERTDLWQGQISLTAVADEVVFGPNGAGFLLEQRPDLLRRCVDLRRRSRRHGTGHRGERRGVVPDQGSGQAGAGDGGAARRLGDSPARRFGDDPRSME